MTVTLAVNYTDMPVELVFVLVVAVALAFTIERLAPDEAMERLKALAQLPRRRGYRTGATNF